jgi:hypothetical protein
VRPPSVLRKRDQWVLWGKDKIPKQIDNPAWNASSTKPATWGNYLEAKKNGHGLKPGFVFSKDDPFVGLDFDNCVENGVIDPSVMEILTLLDSYSEFSPSGTGIHVIVRGVLRTDHHLTEGVPWGGKFEVYGDGRYFTMTGNHVPGTPFVINRRQDELDILVVRFLGKKLKRRRALKPDDIGPGERYPAMRSLMAGFFVRNMPSEEIIERAYAFNEKLSPPLPTDRLSDIPRFMEWLEDKAETDEDRFWENTEILSHIREGAQAQRAAPSAVLCSVLARVAAVTNPRVALPGRGQGSNLGSLNTFVALVGEPGKGKDQAIAASRNVIEMGDQDIMIGRLGSGEGLAHAFKKRTKDGEQWLRRAVLFQDPEVESVNVLGGRQGATLLSELRTAWSAGQLGHMFSDEKKRLLLPGQSYRLCLIAGVQPAKASVILEDVSGGMPQRFVWTLCSDRYAPDVLVEVSQRSVSLGFEDAPEDEFVMKVCKRARLEIDNFAVRSLRGEFDGDPIYGHLLQSRLKVAACLAILHGEMSVTDEWWGLADWVIQQSENARAVCNYYSYQEHKKSVDRRARDQATIAVSVASGLESSYRGRCRDTILRRLEDGPCSRTKLSQAMGKTEIREYLDDVLGELIKSGSIEGKRKSSRVNSQMIYSLP